MGLKPSEYYKLTPVEFGLMYNGYVSKKRERKKELRLLSWFIVKGYADSKSLPHSPEEWWPIDEEEESNGIGNIIEFDEEQTNSALEMIRNTIGG